MMGRLGQWLRGTRWLGRVAAPLVREAGQPGFHPIDWPQAIRLAAEALGRASPERIGFLVGPARLGEEALYVLQKLARVAGTANVDCGGIDLTPPQLARCEAAWGQPIPRQPGLSAAAMLARAAEGGMDVLYLAGDPPIGDPAGLSRLRVRIHQADKLGAAVLAPAKEGVLVLPATSGEHPDWGIPAEIGRTLRPGRASLFAYGSPVDVATEMRELLS